MKVGKGQGLSSCPTRFQDPGRNVPCLVNGKLYHARCLCNPGPCFLIPAVLKIEREGQLFYTGDDGDGDPIVRGERRSSL
jgi:hypothetical protein